MGKYRCWDDRIELWLGPLNVDRWYLGMAGHKHIQYSEIVALFVLKNSLRMVFAGTDEIIVDRAALRYFPSALAQRVQPEPGVSSVNRLITEMRERQAALPDVSWALGRGQGRTISARFIQQRRIAFAVCVLATMIASAVFR